LCLLLLWLLLLLLLVQGLFHVACSCRISTSSQVLGGSPAVCCAAVHKVVISGCEVLGDFEAKDLDTPRKAIQAGWCIEVHLPPLAPHCAQLLQ
jgi:hypothetical protein